MNAEQTPASGQQPHPARESRGKRFARALRSCLQDHDPMITEDSPCPFCGSAFYDNAFGQPHHEANCLVSAVHAALLRAEALTDG